MSNQIRTITVEIRKLSAVEAEVWLKVLPERVSSTTEVRGKLMGPRCPGVTTVEIAYPLQRAVSTDPDTMVVRALIDEPNLWSEKAPFVYEGIAELYESGELVDQRPVCVGLKLG
jgi:hypothetical protein